MTTSRCSCKTEAGTNGVTGSGHRPAEDFGLAFAGSHQQDLFRFQDTAGAHCNRMGRDLTFRSEEAGVGLNRAFCQTGQMAADREMVVGFIEADVPIMADTQQLDIDTAAAFDQRVITAAFLLRVDSDT